MEPYIDDLRQRKQKAAGSEKDRERQHAKGRLTAQERLEVLFDPNTFSEIDTLVTPRYEQYMDGRSSRFGDGVITGFGLINGRRVFAAAEDAAVMGGSLGEMHAAKIVKAMEMALKYGCPFIALQRLRRRASRRALTAWRATRIFDANCEASGVIPQMLGHPRPLCGRRSIRRP